jgi:hypothetical protein
MTIITPKQTCAPSLNNERFKVYKLLHENFREMTRWEVHPRRSRVSSIGMGFEMQTRTALERDHPSGHSKSWVYHSVRVQIFASFELGPTSRCYCPWARAISNRTWWNRLCAQATAAARASATLVRTMITSSQAMRRLEFKAKPWKWDLLLAIK